MSRLKLKTPKSTYEKDGDGLEPSDTTLDGTIAASPDRGRQRQLPKSTITQQLQREPVRQDWSSKQFRLNFTYTALIMLNQFGYGMCNWLMTPCMIDLAKLYGIEMSTLPYVSICQSIGYSVGAIVGLFLKALNRQLTVSGASFVLAGFTAASPYFYPASVAYVGLFCQGLGLGCVGTSFQVWLFEMWPQCSSTALLCASFTYGLGGIAVPLLAKPFVHGNNEVDPIVRLQCLLVPYLTTGLIESVPALLFLVLLFAYPYRNAEPNPALNNPPSSKAHNVQSDTSIKPTGSEMSTVTVKDSEQKFDSKVPNRTLKLMAGLVYLVLYFSCENGFATYGSTMWQHMPAPLSADQAASVASLYASLYTIAPLITAVVSLKCAPDTIIACHYVIISAGLALCYFGSHSFPCINVGSAMLGYGFSPMQGCIFCFVDRYFKLTERWSSAYLAVACLALAGVSFILTRYPIDQHPHMLFYLTGGYLVSSMVMFWTIKFWVSRTNKLPKKRN